MPARRLGQARKPLQGIAKVEIEPLDLMDTASIDIFASRLNQTERTLHILVNNAPDHGKSAYERRVQKGIKAFVLSAENISNVQ